MKRGQKNIKELIKWARDYLILKKLPNPQLVAELVAEEITGKDRINFYLEPEITVDDKQEDLFKKNIRGCGRKIPLAYITGKQHFMGDVFFIRPGIFIPRPETEVLVEEALQLIQKLNKECPGREIIVVDIGTGSGNIAISIAKRIKKVFIYATDISNYALQIAKRNACFHEVQERIEFLPGDLFSPLKEKKLMERIDMIISNPPYVEGKKMRYLPEEVKKEPDFTLNGGEEGLDFYQKIIPASYVWLRKNGFLMLEISCDQAKKVTQILYERFKNLPQIFYDLENNTRVVCIRKT
ncbi:peptide chain release factor N(5)-glutamine methyltransferase [Candidatus Aerophobetes bacterium]|nr:peptide chain release factor N(5)-glutamine methyltransferase [Candidatus Aerophobetes bacterium]